MSDNIILFSISKDELISLISNAVSKELKVKQAKRVADIPGNLRAS